MWVKNRLFFLVLIKKYNIFALGFKKEKYGI